MSQERSTTPKQRPGDLSPEAKAALEDFYREYPEYDEVEDRTCQHCGGTGGEPMDDFITPCEECDGEGFRWWE